MTNLVNEELRRLVADRAGHVCEYCRINEEDTYFGCEIDHIISLKHGGTTDESNLALACMI
jgi:5-methylcytosine-specific restriction endonuclease McrA